MTELTGSDAEVLSDAKPHTQGPIDIDETYWGYILRGPENEIKPRDLRDFLLLFLGGVFMLVGFGQWFLPDALWQFEILPIKIALMAAFVGIGGLLWHTTSRRMKTEVQIDTALRELRVVERDRRGFCFLRERHPMSEIDGAFVKRGEGVTDQAHLLLNLAKQDFPMHLASGRERELRALLERLLKDLKPVAERLESRLLRQAASAMPDRQVA